MYQVHVYKHVEQYLSYEVRFKFSDDDADTAAKGIIIARLFFLLKTRKGKIAHSDESRMIIKRYSD